MEAVYRRHVDPAEDGFKLKLQQSIDLFSNVFYWRSSTVFFLPGFSDVRWVKLKKRAHLPHFSAAFKDTLFLGVNMTLTSGCFLYFTLYYDLFPTPELVSARTHASRHAHEDEQRVRRGAALIQGSIINY